MPTVRIEIHSLELRALHKLGLVTATAAANFNKTLEGRPAGAELEALAGALSLVVERLERALDDEIANATAPERSAMDLPARDD